MKVKLKASVAKNGDKVLLLDKKAYAISDNLSEKASFFLFNLKDGINITKLEEILQDNECMEVYNDLNSNGLLVLSEDVYRDTSLEKTYDFLNYHLGSLTTPFAFYDNKHVAILGCGGVGANIALCLATTGIKRITLVDCDTVNVTNLNRQFAYDSCDVGKSKVCCLRSKIESLNPEIDVYIFDKKITCADDLGFLSKDVDLIVSAIDSPSIKASIYTVEHSIRNDVPIIFGAVGYDSITAGPLLTTADAKDSFLQGLYKHLDIDVNPITGSIASTNLLLCSVMACNITNFFYPISKPDLINVRKVYEPLGLKVISEVKYGAD